MFREKKLAFRSYIKFVRSQVFQKLAFAMQLFNEKKQWFWNRCFSDARIFASFPKWYWFTIEEKLAKKLWNLCWTQVFPKRVFPAQGFNEKKQLFWNPCFSAARIFRKFFHSCSHCCLVLELNVIWERGSIKALWSNPLSCAAFNEASVLR